MEISQLIKDKREEILRIVASHGARNVLSPNIRNIKGHCWHDQWPLDFLRELAAVFHQKIRKFYARWV